MEITSAPPQREPLPQVELKTARLVVRPWTAADVPAVHAACQDPSISYWTSIPSPYSIADAESFLCGYAPAGYANGTEATFGIFLKDTGVIAGAVSVMDVPERKPGQVATAEIGYWANPVTRGRGYVTEAVREVARWAFEELGMNRLRWQAYAGNDASWRVAEKVGFRKVGLQRSSHIVRQGDLIDMWLADLLPSDLLVGGGV